MSRIGKSPVKIEQGVEVNFTKSDAGTEVVVKGKLGELVQHVSPLVNVEKQDETIVLSIDADTKEAKSQHGLYRALIQNMVEGVSKGYTIEQELVGVGYRASAKGQILELSLGYSHPIYFELPKEIKLEAVMEKGKNPLIKLFSYDKQLVGQVAAKIRSFRKPEPYKGKGIRFKGEEIRRKAGKKA